MECLNTIHLKDLKSSPFKYSYCVVNFVKQQQPVFFLNYYKFKLPKKSYLLVF